MNNIGAELLENNRCLFSVWAPLKESMILHITKPIEKEITMAKNDLGYFSVVVDSIDDDCRYFYKPDGENDYPDPASSYQPDGVHGPSQVVDHSSYKWKDNAWKGLPLKDLIIYETHVGTFSTDGTFDSAIGFLDELASTGINAIELMPVFQFPGSRNWGYDGVYPYAVQNSYGGPAGMKRFVDACHNRGIAVLLDVVYNHLGPEGNYLGKFGPYFNGKYHVPWGDAINFDDAWSDGVRDYFACNPCYWAKNYHIDGLRVDAIHTIYDTGAVHLWELVQKKIKRFEAEAGRRLYLIAESDFNNPRVIKPVEMGGYGFDAQWLDDFHHALYVMLDKRGKERYEDFGLIEQIAKSYTDGFVHSGEYVRFRKRKFGASSAGISGEKFVVFNQNHDQIGNRVKGERLSSLVSFEQLKLAAAAIFLSPYIPLLFMGEEYGEENPFYFFVSHSEKALVKAIREGRKKEFEDFKWKTEPPDPQSETTFVKSKINFGKRNIGKYKILLEWNKELIFLRRSQPVLQNSGKNDLRIYISKPKGFILHRRSEDGADHLLCFFNLSRSNVTFEIPSFHKYWFKILDSKEDRWKDPDSNNPGISSPAKAEAGQKLVIGRYGVVVYKIPKHNIRKRNNEQGLTI